MEVKVYSTPTCGYCHQVKQFLQDRGVPFTEYDVSHDRAAAEEMVRLTGQMGVPVIMVNSQVVVGFDQVKLEQLLSQGKGSTGNGKRPRIGLKVGDASKVSHRSGVVPVFGAYVGSVSPASVGEKAGIQPGDIITEVNLRPINSAKDLEKAMQGLTIGGHLNITFLRGQNSMTTEVVV